MKQNQLNRSENSTAKQKSLKEEIALLKRELDIITNKVDAFEALLRSHLTDELIETQELSVLYKAQKKEKKTKRLEQKKRGKRYMEPVGVKIQKPPSVAPELNEDDIREKKRLYREAMLHVHPDKFSLDDNKTDLATELTTRLVEIYKYEDLATLKAYHAHLFSNAEIIPHATPLINITKLSVSPDAYLIKEKEQLEKALNTAKSRHTYHVLTTYTDPSSFIDELSVYYQDRINKLRKRTRTKG